MTEINTLAGKLFSLLKGNGLQVKIFNQEGIETTNPNAGRRFFIAKPNLMVTIDEDSNSIEFSKGANVDSSVNSLQKNIRKIADEFLMNTDIKVFGKTIEPRDFAYQAKMEKGDTMMENNMKPHNHQLVGQIINVIRNFGEAEDAAIAEELNVHLSEVRPILNKLIRDGKIKAEQPFGHPVYSLSMDEAITEESKHKKEIAKKRKEQEKREEKDLLDREAKHGESYHYGTAKVVKTGTDSIKESFSKMFGSLKTSHQTLENVRILVRHKTPVDENVRGSRSRHISAIFLECNGERMRFQHNYLPGARAMAQHMAHGGTFTDKVGSYINESVGQLLKLQSFNRYVTTNKLINEDSSGIIETIKENIETLRTELKKLTGTKTYETVKARLETFEREPLSEDDTSQLKDLFTIRRFDEKFEEVLPIVKQLVQEKDTFFKRIEEAAASPVLLRRESINTTPMFEFASENARLGFKLSEFALRIVENNELSGFINKIGTKLCKEGVVNDFERAVLKQVLENAKVEKQTIETKKDIKESLDLESYFDRFDYKFM